MPRRKLRQRTPLITQPLIGPGFRGLNTELASTGGLVDPYWALVLQNAVFDNNGRLALRKGWIDQTGTPITSTPDIYRVHEYVDDADNRSLIAFTSAFGIWESTDDGDTWSDITGSLSTTTVRWKFVNFEDDVYATAPGHKVWRYTGTGNFTQIAASPVTNGEILAAYGRLWVVNDASSTISYTALLAGTDWTGNGSGSIDAGNAWTRGNDTPVALTAFGATLVVFGKRHILMYVDGQGSEVGVSPDSLYVVDTIEGTGTEHRDSVIEIGEGDVWFLSKQGIQSLRRAVTEKTNPLVDVTANVRSLVQDLEENQISGTGTVQAIFSPRDTFALYLFPEDNKILMLDTKSAMEDGTYRVSEWVDLSDFYSLTLRINGDIIFGLGAGNVALYSGYRDDGGGADTAYDLVYSSPWLDFGPEYHNSIKILKQFYGIFYGRETLTATARWSLDFRPLEFSSTFTSEYDPSGAEFGIGEYGEDEFGEGLRNRRKYIAALGDGQFARLWITIESTDVDALVAIQELGVHAKLGRRV